MAVSAGVPVGWEGGPEGAFAALQARLRPFESIDDAARAEERTVLAIPSINVDPELLARHVPQSPLQHSPSLVQVETIGVLGGFGPQATMDFEARVHRVSQRLIAPSGNRGYPPMVVFYCRFVPHAALEPGSPLRAHPDYSAPPLNSAVWRISSWSRRTLCTCFTRSSSRRPAVNC